MASFTSRERERGASKADMQTALRMSALSGIADMTSTQAIPKSPSVESFFVG